MSYEVELQGDHASAIRCRRMLWVLRAAMGVTVTLVDRKRLFRSGSIGALLPYIETYHWRFRTRQGGFARYAVIFTYLYHSAYLRAAMLGCGVSPERALRDAVKRQRYGGGLLAAYPRTHPGAARC